MGVKYREMTSLLDVPTTQVERVEMPGGVTGGGNSFLLDPSNNNGITAVMALLEEGARIRRTQESFSANGREYAPGTYAIELGPVSTGTLRELASQTGVHFQAGSPRGPTTPISLPRIGLHQAWVASMDAGWITYLFDTYGIPYRTVTNAEIRAGELSNRFDVLVFADQGARQIIEGHAVGTVPPDFVGGIGDEGVRALRDFVEEGGRMVCNNSSCDLPMEEFDLPLKNTLDGVPADSFNCPGALLKAEFDPEHPLAYGMDEDGMLFFSRGRVFEMDEGVSEQGDSDQWGHLPPMELQEVVSYPNEPVLLSGWMIGDELIRGKTAAVDLTYGEGKIFLFGFNVHNRAQARSTTRLLFNALFHH
jgi:hypothetical protein